MTLELLRTIALLCQYSTGITGEWPRDTDSFTGQVKCQQAYITCMEVKQGDLGKNLAICVKGKR